MTYSQLIHGFQQPIRGCSDLLIGGIAGLSYWDRFPMVSALVCMVTHWTKPMVSHDLNLSSVMTSPSFFIMLSLNLERILSLC